MQRARYRLAKAAGATRFGIHMMTGSCVTSNEYWLETTGVLFDTIAKVRAELGIEFEFMNIGGGLGIPYRPGEPEVQPAVIAPSIAKVFAQKRAEHGLADMPAPTLYMECVRSLARSPRKLLSRLSSTHSLTHSLTHSRLLYSFPPTPLLTCCPCTN